jgi:hypothetical protein
VYIAMPGEVSSVLVSISCTGMGSDVDGCSGGLVIKRGCVVPDRRFAAYGYGYGKLRCWKVRKEGNSRVKVGQGCGSAGGYKECETPGVSLRSAKVFEQTRPDG